MRIEPFRNFEAELGRIISGRKIVVPGSGHKGNKIKFLETCYFCELDHFGVKKISIFFRRVTCDWTTGAVYELEYLWMLKINTRSVFFCCSVWLFRTYWPKMKKICIVLPGISFIYILFDRFSWISAERDASVCAHFVLKLHANFRKDPMTCFWEKLRTDKWTNGRTDGRMNGQRDGRTDEQTIERTNMVIDTSQITIKRSNFDYLQFKRDRSKHLWI